MKTDDSIIEALAFGDITKLFETFELVIWFYWLIVCTEAINIKTKKNYRLKKRDLLAQRYKRRRIKLLNLLSMYFYKCQTQ